MTVDFYKTFSKRINSTKQPGVSDTYTSHTCYLKENTSMHDPVLKLKTTEYGYEYAKITWGTGGPIKYYFVVDVISVTNDIVEYHLTEDVLATYKTEVGATQAHILYSSHATDYDPMIIDPRINVKNEKGSNVYKCSTPVFDTSALDPTQKTPHYLLTVLNNQYSASTGFSTTYAVNESGMEEIRAWFCDTNVWQSFQNYFGGNPLDGIIDCKWVPYGIPYSGTTSQIWIGNITNGTGGHAFTTDRVFGMNTYPIINNTYQVGVNLRYDDFRAIEPYTSGTIYLPGFGNLDMNMGEWCGEQWMDIETIIDVISGDITYFLKRHSTNKIVQTVRCNVAVRCPIGHITSDSNGVMAGIGQMVGGTAALVGGVAAAGATGGASLAIAGGVGSIIAGAANTILSQNKHSTSVAGNVGGRTSIYAPYIIHTEFSVNTEIPDGVIYKQLLGRPCNGCRTISALTGYVQCDRASVSGSMNGKEKEEINTFLNSGFYYE